MVAKLEIHGYAIVSRDDCIADAAGVLPEGLRNDRDWAYFQAGLDLADWVVLGRRSHEAAPNPKGRRRLVVSDTARGLEAREDGVWWRPDAIPFVEVATRLQPQGGRIAVPGGQGVFDHFLKVGFTAFHLARAETVELPGGRGMFAGTQNGVSADALLRGANLRPQARRWLDETAQVSLRVYLR